jgi:hypothetical protein
VFYGASNVQRALIVLRTIKQSARSVLGSATIFDGASDSVNIVTELGKLEQEAYRKFHDLVIQEFSSVLYEWDRFLELKNEAANPQVTDQTTPLFWNQAARCELLRRRALLTIELPCGKIPLFLNRQLIDTMYEAMCDPDSVDLPDTRHSEGDCSHCAYVLHAASWSNQAEHEGVESGRVSKTRLDETDQDWEEFRQTVPVLTWHPELLYRIAKSVY